LISQSPIFYEGRFFNVFSSTPSHKCETPSPLLPPCRSLRGMRSKSLYYSWSSCSKNLASQLEQHIATRHLDQPIGRDTVTYCCDVLWMDWAFRLADPGRAWLNRPKIQAIIPLRRLRYDIGTLQGLVKCTCSGVLEVRLWLCEKIL